MRRRTVATLIALLGTAMAVFVFAPIVYSPIHVLSPCNPNVSTCNVGVEPFFESAYESPSCAIFGVGVATAGWVAGTGPVAGSEVWSGSYHIGCPPAEVVEK